MNNASFNRYVAYRLDLTDIILTSVKKIRNGNGCSVMTTSGNVRRASQSKGYESISRDFLQDHSLSWGARGILSYIASMPSNHHIKKTYIYTLCTKNGNGRRAVENMWDELVEAGYIIQFQKMESKGYSYAYRWDDKPFTADSVILTTADMEYEGYKLYMSDRQKELLGLTEEVLVNLDGFDMSKDTPTPQECNEVEDNSISVQNVHCKENVGVEGFPTEAVLHSIKTPYKERFINLRFSDDEDRVNIKAHANQNEKFLALTKLFVSAGVSLHDVSVILDGLSADSSLMDADMIIKQLDWCVIVAKTEGISNFAKYYLMGLKMKIKNAGTRIAGEFETQSVVKALSGYDVSGIEVPMFNWLE